MVIHNDLRMKVKHLLVLLVWFALIILVLGGIVLVGKTAVDNTFTAYENNPVMELGESGDWDKGTMILPDVAIVSDTYHLVYTGLITTYVSAPAIGYATSVDGLTWVKHSNNPILTGDGTGFDAYGLGNPELLFDAGAWVLYYGGLPTAPTYPHDYQIGRATATDPSGPWTRDDNPVLVPGSSGEWDSGFISPDTVLKTNDGYVMYYSGGIDFLSGTGFMIGMATSPDGITWTKYNDPATTSPPFVRSDPVLMPGASGTWDSAMAWLGEVRHTNCGWELYYNGATSLSEASIGYAFSTDGIHWTKDAANPIYEAADDTVTLTTGDIVETPSVLDIGNERWMFYDYGQGDIPPAVGIAKAPLSCQSVYLPVLMK